MKSSEFLSILRAVVVVHVTSWKIKRDIRKLRGAETYLRLAEDLQERPEGTQWEFYNIGGYVSDLRREVSTLTDRVNAHMTVIDEAQRIAAGPLPDAWKKN